MRLALALLAFASLLPAQSKAVLAALATGTYFPLDVGDRWVYREDIRVATATYQTWRVDRTETVNGSVYSVIAVEGPYGYYGESWFRADTTGRVYLLTGAGDVLFMDPTTAGPTSGEVQLQNLAGGSTVTALGTFPDTLPYVNFVDVFDMEKGILARGIGLLSSTTDLQTGSSGGPVLIRTLVEAHVAGGIDFPAPQSSIELGMESLNLDVSGMKVTNCAVPCYFAACYEAPGQDPAGTYKPCARARVALKNWPTGESRSVTLQLLAPGGATAFTSTFAMDSSPTDSVTFLQVPLYSAPNQPLAPGTYQLQAATGDGAAQSSITVKIQ
jgi:hypothetical protein